MAACILAHDQPRHLSELVSALRCDWIRVFIHIDKKADIAPFKALTSEDGSVVVFLSDDERIRVNWGGFSQIEATLSLLHASLNCGERFDRFCLLSGSDFPIKPLNAMRHGLNSRKEFMRVDRRLDASDDNSHCRYVRFFISGISRLPRKLIKNPPDVYDRISLYHGSNWWALTEGCIEYIVDYIDRNQDYTDFHRYTNCPDEIFFHSIVKHSPFAANITHDFETAGNPGAFFALNEHGCHYVDWTSKGIPLPEV